VPSTGAKSVSDFARETKSGSRFQALRIYSSRPSPSPPPSPPPAEEAEGEGDEVDVAELLALCGVC
jgi:hypothetical protein